MDAGRTPHAATARASIDRGRAGLLGLALLTGVLTPLAYQPWQLPWLAWVVLAPLLLAVRWTTPARAGLLGLLAGIVRELLGSNWLVLSGVHPGAWLLIVLVAASRDGLFALLGAGVYRRRPRMAGLLVPTLWVLLEYLRVHVAWLSIPWGLLGHTQAEVPAMARIAGLTGVYGVSFVLLTGNLVVAESAHRVWLRLRRGAAAAPAPALAGPVVLAVLLLVGANLPSAPPDGTARQLRVAVVQGGVYDPSRGDLTERAAVFERYVRLTRQAAERHPDLVIWPESSVPGSLPDDTGALGILFRLAHELQTPLLVAAGGRDKTTPASGAAQVANSAFLIGPERRVRARYDKMRLLPFNEYLPLRGWVRWPSWIGSNALRDAAAGTRPATFETAGLRYRVQICWEGLFPSDARSFRDVDFLVTLTNESFTETRAGTEQLFAMNAFRAMEAGVPLVRASTTSVSAVIGADGRVVARLESGEGSSGYGFFVTDLVHTRPSPYARVGDSALILLTGPVLAGLGIRWRGGVEA